MNMICNQLSIHSVSVASLPLSTPTPNLYLHNLNPIPNTHKTSLFNLHLQALFMDFCYNLSLHTSPPVPLFPSSLKSATPRGFSTVNLRPPAPNLSDRCSRLSSTVVASAGASHCDFSSLNTPHQPRSPVAKFLSSVLLNQRSLFHVAVADELKHLAQDRRATLTRMLLSSADETCLHRRIAQIKQHECQIAIEDIMYVLILSKFSEIRVPLVPKLSKCIYNGRLEIWPSKDWELESIYGFEVLEMIREHVSTVIGLRVNSSVTDNWATTKIQRPQLGRIYAASVLYGYFIKSASLRHHLEQNLDMARQDLFVGQRTSLKCPEMFPNSYKNLVFGRRVSKVQSALMGKQGSSKLEMEPQKLRGYVMGFDPEALQRCAKVRSKEAVNLIQVHSSALFGDEETCAVETDETILTSFSSLKRLVLEAVAFGYFLWDTEEYVGTMYMLEEN